MDGYSVQSFFTSSTVFSISTHAYLLPNINTLRISLLGFVAYAHFAPVMYIYTPGALELGASPKNQLL